MKSLFVSVLAIAAGCGGARYQRQVVGHGTAPVLARADEVVPPEILAAPGGGGVALDAGDYEVNLHFAFPRAQIIDWRVRCADGTAADGSVGETLEAYRERRARELRAERDRVASTTSAVVGAFAPSVSGGARGPQGGAQVEAGVDANAVGAAAGGTVDVVVPAWDVGGGAVEARAGFSLAAPSTCAIHAITEDKTVVASYQLVKRRDLKAEREEATRVASAGAIDVRGRVRAQLIAHGASEHPPAPVIVAAPPAITVAPPAIEPTVVISAEVTPTPVVEPPPPDPRRDAAIAVRGHVTANLRAIVSRNAQLEAERERAHGIAITEARARRTLVFQWLVDLGADPGRRARVAAEREQRREAELAIQLEADARAAADAEAAANLRAQAAQAEAQIRQQRVDAALDIRLRLRAHLVARGAVERPPMPAPMPEDPGAQPFDGAIWVAGEWNWTGRTWEWTVGGWTDSATFADAGTAENPPSQAIAPTVLPAAIEGTGTVSVEVPTTVTVEGPTPPPVPTSGPTVVVPVGITVEVTPRPAPRPVVRDHRAPPRRPVIRDHRRR